MKRFLIILSSIVVVVLIVYGCGEWSDRKVRLATQHVREELRRTGYRTDLAEFKLKASAELCRRGEILIANSQALSEARLIGQLELMHAVGTNVAFHLVPMDKIPFRNPDDRESNQEQNLWDVLEVELGKYQQDLDRIAQTLLAGDFQFEPREKGGEFLLPHLAHIKRLSQALSERAVLKLHRHEPAAAFTNLLALTRLVTAWKPQPMEIEHLVRAACTRIAQRTLWETTQTAGLNEEQYLALQREWESLLVFENLADVAALSRASAVRSCELVRAGKFSDEVGPWGDVLGQAGRMLFRAPKQSLESVWQHLQAYRRYADYKNTGSYEDEKGLLLYYRDREAEMKQALAGTNWLQMRALPGVTNQIAFQGGSQSRFGVLLNLRQISTGFANEGRSLLGRLAETESLRRVIVTAIALERYFLQHSNYPPALTGLVPQYLARVPVDFIDGQPLRYRLGADGRYLLYSIGLDGVDHGGQMVNQRFLFRGLGIGSGEREAPYRPNADTDIGWPMPAVNADVERYNQIVAEAEAKMEARRKRFEEESDPSALPEAERIIMEKYR